MGNVAVLSSSATRHSCKVCRKGFPCGRSLGGHMRSHPLAEVETAVEDDADDNGEEEEQRRRRGSDFVTAPAAGGYGLRENPKKTRRLSGLDGGGGDDDESGARRDFECGHGGEELLSPCAPEADQERCSHAPGVGAEVEQEDAMLIPLAEPVAGGLMPAPRRRRRSMRVPAPAPPPAFDKEPEDVALCLIMLSRDILDRRRDSAAGYSPAEKNRRKRERDYYHHDADSDDASALYQYTDVEVGTRISKRKPNHRSLAGDEKRTRYECPGCGRAFQSYQALGGHRASHKRINSNCSIAKVAPEQPEPSVETNVSFSTASMDADYAADIPYNSTVVALKAKPLKSIKFECPICFKVFGSGQALGGHKRSHSIAGELYQHAHADGDAGTDKLEQPMVADGFLDLNLPAPGAED